MSLYELIPKELLTLNEKQTFLLWLKYFPVPWHTKRYLLFDWCEYIGLKITRALLDEAGIPRVL